MSNTPLTKQNFLLVRHSPSGINEYDDPSFPFRMELYCTSPEFLEFAHDCIHGRGERVVARAMTLDLMNWFIDKNSLRTHPRLVSLIVTGPEGTIEEIKRE